EAIAIYDELDAEQARFVEESKALSLEELVQELNAGNREPRPATTDEIKQLEMRMGIALPDLLRDFYLQTNGLPMTGLLPIAEVRPIDPDLLTDGELQYHVYEGRLSFYDHAYNELVVPVAETANWWQIGYSEEWLTYLFVNPNAAVGDHSLFEISIEEATAYKDLLAKLRFDWANEKSSKLYEANSERMFTRAIARMQNHSIDELIEMFPKPGLLERFVLSGRSLPRPASASLITETEKRIGRSLPADHAELLSIHNGFGAMFLLPADQIESARTVLEASRRSTLDLSNADNDEILSMEELNQCWVVAGLSNEGYEDPGETEMYGHIYWCPELGPDRQYLSQIYGGYHPTLTAVVRHAAAQAGYGY
ncbi:MAG: SMI1/KNR4 family protein, partial [Woeseiaceae bacterium]